MPASIIFLHLNPPNNPFPSPLRYEADGKFDTETRSCTFLSAHELWDVDDEDVLTWRREDEDWEPPAEEGDPGAQAEGGTVQMRDVVAYNDRIARLRGRTLDEDAAEVLGTLSPDHARLVAEGYREFSDFMG